jgi:oligopeptide transport system substrate-binding protein
VPEFDPDRARELYQRGVQELGREPPLEMLIDDSAPSSEIAPFLQYQLQENLGAEVKVNRQPFEHKIELENSGQFQVSMDGWSADYNDPMTFLDVFTSDSPLNTANFRSERYDMLIDEARTEVDPAKRMDMLLEAERLLVEKEAVLAPLYFLGDAKLIKPRLKSYDEHPYGPFMEFKYARIEP